MKNVKSKTRTRLADERLEVCMRNAATELDLILKDYTNKSSVNYLINDWLTIE
jgi:hypothetical protein